MQFHSTEWFSYVLSYQMYLSEPVTVSLGGGRNNYFLSPVGAVEILQVFLNGLQPGQFGRKVNGRHTSMVGVPAQLFLQSFVDLIQGAQEELQRVKKKDLWSD